jgi:hypothetical protein
MLNVMISVYCYAEYVYVVCHYSECCAEYRGSGTILAGKARSLPLEWSPVRSGRFLRYDNNYDRKKSFIVQAPILTYIMNKLQLAGQNLGRVFNVRA